MAVSDALKQGRGHLVVVGTRSSPAPFGAQMVRCRDRSVIRRFWIWRSERQMSVGAGEKGHISFPGPEAGNFPGGGRKMAYGGRGGTRAKEKGPWRQPEAPKKLVIVQAL